MPAFLGPYRVSELWAVRKGPALWAVAWSFRKGSVRAGIRRLWRLCAGRLNTVLWLERLCGSQFSGEVVLNSGFFLPQRAQLAKSGDTWLQLKWGCYQHPVVRGQGCYCPECLGQSLQQRICRTKISVVPRVRNPAP